jgi:RHS repeat-associated protein
MTLATAPAPLRAAVQRDLGSPSAGRPSGRATRFRFGGGQPGTTYRGGGVDFAGSGFRLDVGAASLGRGRTTRPVPSTFTPTPTGGTYRNAQITESFRATTVGTEETFSLARRVGAAGRLVIDVPVSGLRATNDHGSIDLRGPTGRTDETYFGLRAIDASGMALAARMRAVRHGTAVAIDVDDRRARYPLTVDPTWSLVGEPPAPDGAGGDNLGSSVAVSGTTAVVGADNKNGGQGAAYIFGLVAGAWTETAELPAALPAGRDFFGYSAAISGTTVVVGADNQPGTYTGQGAAYVFTLNGGTWTQTGELTALDGYYNDTFGASVGLSGASTVVVGAPHRNDYQGAAYIFTLSGGTWGQTQELTGPAGDSSEKDFGTSVGVSGTTVAVGAPTDTVATNADEGAVYIYASAAGTWTETQELDGIDSTQEDSFGQSVAIAGTSLVAGAPGHTTGGRFGQGAAYVFGLAGGTWSQTDELTATDGAGDDELGISVGISGLTVTAGASGHEVGGNANQGAAYVFTLGAGSWTQTAELEDATGGGVDDFFGTSVGVAGTTVAVGAPEHAVGTNSEQGAVYIFSSVTLPAGAITPGNTPGSGDPAVPNSPTCSCGGPVTMSTGTQWLSRSDLSTPGRGIPLGLSETYSSTTDSVEGPFGFGWSWSYGIDLTNGDGTPLSGSPSSVRLNEETGAEDAFALSGSSWAPGAARVDATLIHNGGGTWTVLRAKTETLQFNASGLLTAETDLNGETTTVTYPSATTMVITDPAGRTFTVTLSTAAHPLITQVVASGTPARTVSFGYDTNGNLTSVTDVDGGITSYGYDTSHRLVEERSPRYYTTGALPAAPTSCSATPPANITSSVYDSNGRVICQWDADGRKTAFSWVDDGLGDGLVSSATLTDPKGNVTQFNFEYGELISKTEGYGTAVAATWTYAYDPATLGLILSQDPNGNVTTATFDAYGNKLSETDPLGRTTTWTYNAYNEVTSDTPPATYGTAGAVTTSYSYDEAAYSSGGHGNLTTVSTPMLSASGTSEGTQTTHYVHGSSTYPGDVTSMIDPGGNTWTYTYDTFGDRISEAAPATSDNSDRAGSASDTTKWAYNTGLGWLTATLAARYVLANPTATTCTTPAVGCTTYTHDNMGRVLVTTDGDGDTATAHYDADGNEDYSIDGNTNRTNYTHNPAGQLTVTTRPDATTLTTDYWPDGSIEDQIDGNGADTHYTYDPLGHLTGVTDPDSRTTGYQYDGVGNLLVKSDPGVTGCSTASTTSGCTLYTYDPANEQTSITYNNTDTPNVTAETYDGDSRRVSMTEQHGSGSATSTWAYDSLGDLTSATDSNGKTVGYTYDTRQDQLSVVYPGTTGTVTKTFDPAGREATLADWLGHTTNFAYNADSQLGTQTSPTTGTAVVDTYAYDGADTNSSVTVTQGSTTLGSYTYGRDANHQVSSVTSTGVPPENQGYGYNTLNQLTSTGSGGYTYDKADNPIQLAATTVQTYDPANQLKTSSRITVVGTVTASNTGTTASTTLTLPTGTTTNDQIIVAATLNVGPTVTTPTGYTLIGRYASGSGTTNAQTVIYRKTAVSTDTNVALTFSASVARSMTLVVYRGVNPTSPVDTTTSVTAAGATTATIPTAAPAQAGDRILLVEGAASATTAGTFTRIANYTTEAQQQTGTAIDLALFDKPDPTNAATGTETATFSTSAQLTATAILLAPNQTTYTYDTRGNRTTVTPPGGTATTLGYDQADRLISYGTTATYTYNGDNLRMTKAVSGTTENYTYDQTATTPQIIVDGTTNYLYGPQGDPLEQIVGTTVTWYHHDQLGSTRILTNTTGTVIGTATYNAYGTPTTTGTTTPLGYTGAYTDTETGYQYLTNRYYDPQTAQFLSVDPLVAETGSAYGYVYDDPVNGTDPSGLFCIGSVCTGFHPLQGLKGAVNFAAGAANFVTSTVSLGYWHVSAPFCGYGLGTSYDIGGWTGWVEAGLAGGLGDAAAVGEGEAPWGQTPEGRPFTQHYGTETGPVRNIPGSVVDQTINDYTGVPGRGGTTVYYDPNNDVTVVTGRNGGIVSARRGAP